MAWEIEGTEEFQAWFSALTSAERISVAAKIDLLEEEGPSLGRPHADTLKGSKLTNLKELIIQHAGNRKADSKWYKTAIPEAEKVYERYLEEIKDEGLI